MSRVPSSTGFDPARIIEDHQAGVWRYLRALGCDPPLADDLTQETFLAVLEKPFRAYDAAATAAYLRKVAHNLLVSHWRKDDRMASVGNLDAIDVQWTRWVSDGTGQSLLEALEGCFASLGERAQLAMRLRYRERKSRVEIGTALGITEHGAKNLMQRAKQSLRACIEGKLR